MSPYRLPSLLIAALILTACKPSIVPSVTKPDPYHANCEESCWTKCEPLPIWEPGVDGYGNWDVLAGPILAEIRSQYDICDARRLSCANCLDHLKVEKIIQ